LWKPIDGFGVLWRHLCIPALEPAWHHISSAAEASEELTVFASPLVLGARVARETHRFRLVSGVTAPSALRSLGDPQFIGAVQVPRWTPTGLRRVAWAALDRFKLEPLAQERLHPFRRKLGLPDMTTGTFSRWLLSPDRIVGMFPESFAPRHRDWPPQLQLCGFPLYRPKLSQPPNQALHEFLTHGPKPVLLFTGSAGTFPPDRLRICLGELRKAGRRVVVVSPTLTPTTKAELAADDRLMLETLPLNQILPHVEAVIHHGGIGTIAESLEADVPQWIWPSAYDQHENAARVAERADGRVLRNAKDLAQALARSQAQQASPPAQTRRQAPWDSTAAETIQKIVDQITAT
jgi:rhamnosyltransferase subunit B